MMVRVGDRNAQADIGKLLAQGVQQQSQDLLGELLDGRKANRRDWLESCREMLKEERDDYFRASCMEQGGVGNDGFVESAFVVRFGNDWKPIWKSKIPIDLRSVPDAAQKQVENDPQIRSLLTLVESLGVGSRDTVDRAVKMGAATMQAQSQVNQQFEFFRQRFQHRLDIPVLRWDVTSPDRLPRR
jgi:malate synthase